MLAFVFVRGGVLGRGGGGSPHTCAFSLLVGRRLNSVGVRDLLCSLLVWPQPTIVSSCCCSFPQALLSLLSSLFSPYNSAGTHSYLDETRSRTGQAQDL